MLRASFADLDSGWSRSAQGTGQLGLECSTRKTAVDQTGSGQADAAVQTGFEPTVLAEVAEQRGLPVEQVALAGQGYPAEQRGWVARTGVVRSARQVAPR